MILSNPVTNDPNYLKPALCLGLLGAVYFNALLCLCVPVSVFINEIFQKHYCNKLFCDVNFPCATPRRDNSILKNKKNEIKFGSGWFKILPQ